MFPECKISEGLQRALKKSYKSMRQQREKDEVIKFGKDSYLRQCSRCKKQFALCELIIPSWRESNSKVCIECYNILKLTKYKKNG